MTSASLGIHAVEFEALLAPVSGDAPAGESLLYDAAFDRLREASREEDPTLPQGIWKRDLKRANWTEVEGQARSLLATRTKDLQIAAWLAGAWIRLYGFAGARNGFALLLALSDRYWDTVHPLPEGEDYSSRALVFEWMNERLRMPLEAVLVTQPVDPTMRAFSWTEREEALQRDQTERRKSGNASLASSHPVTSVAFTASVTATPREFYRARVDDLGDALTAATALGRLLDDRCGADAPSLVQLIGSMSTVRDWMQTMLAESEVEQAIGADMGAAPPPPEKQVPGGAMGTATLGAGRPMGDHALARAEAYQKLAEAAQLLMRIEPHSPTPYLVRRAIAWGGMPLSELMRHFIESGYDLKSLYSMLGMDEGEPE